jgi:tRNA pseudouridine55 synthase
VTVAPGGIVLVDKPAGPSSFRVVRGLRDRYGVKAGHAGTLDPAASGLLLVLLGPATRLARYLVGLDKRYLTTIRLGERTTTGDAEGSSLEATSIPYDVDAELARMRGEVELPVPAASAVKIAGERAYRLHRRGVTVEMPLRRSRIDELRVLRFESPDLDLELGVSSGTYVRAIADALGGHCTALRRIAVGSFLVEDADEGVVLSPRAALPHLPEAQITPAEAELVRRGRPIAGRGDGATRLVCEGQLVAVARVEDGSAKPETVLPS